jgi:GTP cyclohydrolase I
VKAKLIDTQSERDPRNIAISRVGVNGLRYPITLRHPDGRTTGTSCEASLTVSLSATERGTHMSRFVEELHLSSREIHPAAVIALAKKLRTRLKAEGATAELTLPWFIEKKAPVTGQAAWMDYTVTWKASVTARSARLHTTIKVPLGTLCPCSKAISDRGAHNQRGYATVTVETATPVWPDVLINAIESAASCDLYSLLKRPDEKFVTERAYDRPVFVEDLVRDIAIALRRLKGLRGCRIEAVNLESIHSHNACALIDSLEPLL